MPRADYHATAARAVKQAIASALYPDQLVWRDEDLEAALKPRQYEAWAAGQTLATIIDAACDEAVGEVVDRIRRAEGVDTAAVDAALGVEQDEEGDDSDVETGRDPFKIVDH